MSLPCNKFRSLYHYYETIDHSFDTIGPSKTRGEFKDECDINFILQKFENQSYEDIIRRNPSVPKFDDFTSIPDYQESLNTIIAAQHSFNLLPAKLRDRFNNNPAELLKFMQQPENKEEGIKLGLYESDPIPEPEPEPIKVKVINQDVKL